MVARWFSAPIVLMAVVSASLPVPSFAQAPSSRAEVYVADTRGAPLEAGLSSTLELQPSGRFDWRLNMRGVALTAHGTWDRDRGMIHLNNPEQVGEPAIQLAGTARDARSALRVRLDPATARMASVLEVELEFRGNEIVRLPFSEGEVRIAAGEGRPLSVRLASEAFGIRTQAIRIAPRGNNVLTLRLAPADLGQALFGSQQTRFSRGGLTIDWRGIALRYNRLPLRTSAR